MVAINSNDLQRFLTTKALVEPLQRAFGESFRFPKRHHHQFPNPKAGQESTLLLMPAWDRGDRLGVKIVTVSPKNNELNLPTIQGVYLLFDLRTGEPIAQMDAKLLTNKRTAATSALASSLLSRPESSTLLMMGTGALCCELIEAHAAVRPVSQVYIWGRNAEKARAIAATYSHAPFQVASVLDYREVIHQADIVSCATLSATPLITADHLSEGQHFDLVGAYKPDMREADDGFISSVSVHVDTYEGATTETGDLYIPLKTGVILREDLKSELSELCSGQKPGRQTNAEITCFKSVGHALEDLVAASLAYDKYLEERDSNEFFD